jgi:dihydropteroate synthase
LPEVIRAREFGLVIPAGYRQNSPEGHKKAGGLLFTCPAYKTWNQREGTALGIQPRKLYTLEMGARRLELGARTLIMGILNVTPDSFSDGGRFAAFEQAVAQAFLMIGEGAGILDIGGESTRPNSDPVPPEAELERVIPVIEAVRKESDIPISIDSTKAEVAKRALAAGANIINDVSALQFDPEMVRVAASSGAPLILMHMLGSPKTMQQNPSYSSLFSEIIAFLEERIRFAVENGVERSQIVVDPGIGFGKTVAHNLAIIKNLEAFHCLGRPILLGASRKRFIGSVLEKPEVDREIGTAVVSGFAVGAGAHILRIHDVGINRQAALMADAIRNA